MGDVSFEMGLFLSPPAPEFPCGHWTRVPGKSAILCGRPSGSFYAAVDRPDLRPRARCRDHRIAPGGAAWREASPDSPGERDAWREISYEEAVVFTVMVR